jgi:hypothetical protein
MPDHSDGLWTGISKAKLTIFSGADRILHFYFSWQGRLRLRACLSRLWQNRSHSQAQRNQILALESLVFAWHDCIPTRIEQPT